jgi:hypothetical protein
MPHLGFSLILLSLWEPTVSSKVFTCQACLPARGRGAPDCSSSPLATRGPRALCVGEGAHV